MLSIASHKATNPRYWSGTIKLDTKSLRIISSKTEVFDEEAKSVIYHLALLYDGSVPKWLFSDKLLIWFTGKDVS